MLASAICPAFANLLSGSAKSTPIRKSAWTQSSQILPFICLSRLFLLQARGRIGYYFGAEFILLRLLDSRIYERLSGGS